MRNIILFMLISLDGFFEGKDHDLSWHNVDDEFNTFASEQLREIDTLLFGRVTFQLFEGYWPQVEHDPQISSDNLEIAKLINSMKKIVFSKTLSEVNEKENWKNITLFHDLNKDHLDKMKKQPGKSIGIFGSNNLAVNLIKENAIDEFRIMINPITIEDGSKLFKGLGNKLKLNFFHYKTFHNGNVLLYYKRA